MRYMRPDRENDFPSKYICTDCNWSYPLEHLSEVADFFQERSAIREFSAHDCSGFRLDLKFYEA
jgi:hypothetical protein